MTSSSFTLKVCELLFIMILVIMILVIREKFLHEADVDSYLREHSKRDKTLGREFNFIVDFNEEYTA